VTRLYNIPGSRTLRRELARRYEQPAYDPARDCYIVRGPGVTVAVPCDGDRWGARLEAHRRRWELIDREVARRLQKKGAPAPE